jgi:hypothetical protein
MKDPNCVLQDKNGKGGVSCSAVACGAPAFAEGQALKAVYCPGFPDISPSTNVEEKGRHL